ncbi:deoxyuridine triphosphatase [Carp edema virus]|nr:deoxyuridine triphosphatase [Carp edema virus]
MSVIQPKKVYSCDSVLIEDESQYEHVIYVKKEDGALFDKCNNFAAGYDLFAMEDVLIQAHSAGELKHGVAFSTRNMENYEGMFFLLSGRSSANKRCLLVFQGIIDIDYQGILTTRCFNLTNEAILIKKGMAISQLVLVNNMNRKFYFKLVDEFPNKTERGDKGFGSSGNNV